MNYQPAIKKRLKKLKRYNSKNYKLKKTYV